WTHPALPLGTFALCALVCGPAHAADKNAVVKSFANGTSRNSIGMIDATEDAPQDGPQAIYAADDGNLYLLDQINNRVLRFDAKQPSAPVQSLELPADVQPTDIVVRGGSVYVWDGKPTALQPSGADGELVRSLTRVRAAAPPDEATLSAFAQMGS